eukprot:g1335.t1
MTPKLSFDEEKEAVEEATAKKKKKEEKEEAAAQNKAEASGLESDSDMSSGYSSSGSYSGKSYSDSYSDNGSDSDSHTAKPEMEEEAASKKKEEEGEAAQKKAEEEAKRKAEEEAKTKAEEEAAIMKEKEQEEAAKKKAEEEEAVIKTKAKEEAATKIESSIRGKFARSEKQKELDRIIMVESRFRGIKGMKLAHKMKLEKTAATKIQAIMRGKFARSEKQMREENANFQRRENVRLLKYIVRLQSYFRGIHGRKVGKQMRKQRFDALWEAEMAIAHKKYRYALRIQSIFRGHLSRKKTKEKSQEAKTKKLYQRGKQIKIVGMSEAVVGRKVDSSSVKKERLLSKEGLIDNSALKRKAIHLQKLNKRRVVKLAMHDRHKFLKNDTLGPLVIAEDIVQSLYLYKKRIKESEKVVEARSTAFAKYEQEKWDNFFWRGRQTGPNSSLDQILLRERF